ncbi:MAG: V-type ATP synthase subunit F [Burkholderiaceae bacterium]
MDDRSDKVTLAFVGDALAAAGFRLAGVRVFSPQPGEERAAFAQALAAAAAVFVTAEVAAKLEGSELERALAAATPLVAIVPDGAPASFDPAERVRRQLGVER